MQTCPLIVPLVDLADPVVAAVVQDFLPESEPLLEGEFPVVEVRHHSQLRSLEEEEGRQVMCTTNITQRIFKIQFFLM